jgi:hypothetical protein
MNLTGLILVSIKSLPVYAEISPFLLETPCTILTPPCDGCQLKTHADVIESRYQRERVLVSCG